MTLCPLHRLDDELSDAGPERMPMPLVASHGLMGAVAGPRIRSRELVPAGSVTTADLVPDELIVGDANAERLVDDVIADDAIVAEVVAVEVAAVEAAGVPAAAASRWVGLLSSTAAKRTVPVLVVVTIAVELAVLWPYIAHAIDSIDHLRFGWLALAVWAEFASVVAFSRLQRVFLRSAGVRVPLRSSLATVLAANAISVTLPAGTLGSIAYSTRRMRRWGASSGLVAFSLGATGILCTIGLAVVALAGGFIAADADNLAWTGAELVGALALVTLTMVVLRRSAQVRDRIDHGSHATRLRGIAVRFLDQLTELHPASLTWSRGALFAIGKWSMDLLCLLAACRAVGATPSLTTVVLAYAAAMAAATSIPFIPAGLGVVDAALVVALQHGTQALPLVTAGVVVYRLISLGLMAGSGWAILIVREFAGRRRHAQRAAAA